MTAEEVIVVSSDEEVVFVTKHPRCIIGTKVTHNYKQ